MLTREDVKILPSTTAPLEPHLGHFVYGVSLAMRALERVIIDIAPTDIPVLLVGESGTGKEVIALQIHRLSRRWNEAFVKCKCVGLPDDSLTTRLLSGDQRRADDPGTKAGTVFLDEISQLDTKNQNCLLRLLPEGELIGPYPKRWVSLDFSQFA